MEENVAMHHPTRNGLTFQVRSFGPGGSIEKKNRVLSPPPKELTKEDARTAKIKKAVLHVLRKEGFGGVRKDLRTLKKLRKEQKPFFFFKCHHIHDKGTQRIRIKVLCTIWQ